MADAVQYVMEKMIPELEDLQHLQIFTKDEVRQIVQKRRDFEYTMKRTPLRKVDCLRYIEYELNLDALRRQRKKRMGLTKLSLSDHSGMQRVHNIFDRALMKHRGDVDLWLQHIAFCKNTGSSKLLSKLFTNTRREVLGLDTEKTKPKELSLDIAPVDGEDTPIDATTDSESATEKSRQEILQGAIPKIVFRNAIQAIPQNAAFRLAFIAICNLFPATYGHPVAKFILDSTLADFPNDATVWSSFCEQAMHESDSADVDSRRKVALESPWFGAEMAKTIETLGPLSSTLYAVYIDYTLRVKGLEAAVAVAAKATAAFPTFGTLWQLRAQLVLRLASVQQVQVPTPASKRAKKQPTSSSSSVYKTALAVVEQGLRVATVDTDGLWQRHVQLLLSQGGTSSLGRQKNAFHRALKAATPWTAAWSTLRMQFLQWTLRTQGVEAARTLYKSFLNGQMLPQADTLALLRWCVLVEAAQEVTPAANAAVKGLMEKVVDLFGQTDEDVWVEYVQFYRERGLHKEANDVHWRATRVFPSSTALATLQELN
ncbi:hypothetical protein DYB38_001226 [Aphanomyces astaci]|uniref:U3 small nucleolar RNA-associated protein 6 n=2 Tax=Aphanomyces astaci TaxID=112090 RepID=A0A397D541_APHAT|nr:hypothetical protein DYB34_000468 [Aphanomyces astaci]RHY56212.1 hypothetical protein DYB38_001226 [Aphanomyces astaci]